MPRSKAHLDPLPPPKPGSMLTDHILAHIGEAGNLREWNQLFYRLQQEPDCPAPIKRLVFQDFGGALWSEELTHMVRFIHAANRQQQGTLKPKWQQDAA